MAFTPIKSVLPSSLDRAGVKETVEAAMVLEAFMKIARKEFGEEIVTKIKPLYVKNGTLTISCTSSILATDMKTRERKLLQKLSAACPKAGVQRLRFFL